MRPEVVAAITQWLAIPAADPGRIHEEGRTVRVAVEEARDRVAELVGVRNRQVVFTSSGTEAINTAVWGAARLHAGAVILCAAVEHSAVRDASERLAPVERLEVDHTGRIELADLEEALRRRIDDQPALVHCQWANHEVGTIQPVHEVVDLCRHYGVLVHVDACAAAGHLDLDLIGLDADLVSISAHKLGGPPGVGALIVRKGLRLEPLLVGGQQERARRAGLENMIGIVGFGAAAKCSEPMGARACTKKPRPTGAWWLLSAMLQRRLRA